MKDNLKYKCDLFANNYKEVSRKFWGNYSVNNRLGALLYTLENKTIEIETIKNCKKVIKENAGVFSKYKDVTYFMTAVMLSLQKEPEKVFKNTINIYEAMKKEGFKSSIYLTVAALSIALQAEPLNYHRMIVAAKGYYDAMKSNHRFITNSEDYGYTVLLAMAEKPLLSTVREIEACYENFSDTIFPANSIQSLSHVLALSDESAALKCNRVNELYQALKNKGCKFGNRKELPVLGALTLITENTREVAEEMVEVNQYLKTKKGFGGWSISNKERLLYAAAIISKEYAEDTKDKTMELSITNSITGILIAQQMAMISAAAASSAAAAASAAN